MNEQDTAAHVRPPMLEGERSEAYVRRTGYWPPHWTSERCQVFDAKSNEMRRYAEPFARRWLRRWGYLDEG
jgi:hypothetical protein